MKLTEEEIKAIAAAVVQALQWRPLDRAPHGTSILLRATREDGARLVGVGSYKRVRAWSDVKMWDWPHMIDPTEWLPIPE